MFSWGGVGGGKFYAEVDYDYGESYQSTIDDEDHIYFDPVDEEDHTYTDTYLEREDAAELDKWRKQ